MSILGYCLQINILRKFHVLSVDSENLESTDLVGYTNIDLSIKTTKSSKSRIKSIRSVSGSNDNNMSSTFQAVHEGEHLWDNSSFDLAVYFFSVGGNWIDLVDEDDCWTVLFGLFEGFS